MTESGFSITVIGLDYLKVISDYSGVFLNGMWIDHKKIQVSGVTNVL